MKHLPDVWRGERWEPFQLVSQLQKRMDRLFSDLIEPSPGSFLRESEYPYAPVCDLEETDAHYLASFDLPGLSKDDVKIEVRDRQLIVSGERKEEKKAPKTMPKYVERSYGAFQRTVVLPSDIDPDRVEANFHNGVLYIALPKIEASKPKAVKISEGKSKFITEKAA